MFYAKMKYGKGHSLLRNPQHFRHLFKKEVGMTLSEYNNS